MENVSKYELIHIDTLESVMCEKITIEGENYYYRELGIIEQSEINGTIIETLKIKVNDIEKRLIATTNTSLQCPQVVDDYYRYIILWNKCFNEKEKSMGNSHLYDHITGRQAFRWGYKAHSETHSLSDEEVIRFAWWVLNNPQSTSGTMKATLEIFKSTLPIKVYYR